MLNVFCVRVGDRYPADYVFKLKAMFSRYLGVPHRFACVTDNVGDLDFGIQCFRPEHNVWGWWSLMEAWQPQPRWAIPGWPILYVGLDTVIRADITEVLKERLAVNRLTLLRDFSELIGARTMFTGTYADGVAFIPAGGVPEVWSAYLAENLAPDNQFPMHVFTTKVMKQHGIVPDFWQDVAPNFVCSYKWPEEKLVEPSQSIVCFHGEPRPAEAIERAPWIKEYWKR